MASLHERLGIEVPVFQAPMAGSQNSRLAIAVARAGGLGALPCGMLDADAITAEVETIRGATDKSFNLNFLCHTPPSVDAARESAMRARLEPYRIELGVDEASLPPVLRRDPFGPMHAERVEALRPRVVSFHFGLPPRELVDRIHAVGALVFSSATTVDEALYLADHGADAIITQGLEAGGHRGHFLSPDLDAQTPLLPLLDAIRPRTGLPLIAAGGIATPQDVTRAVLHGADAVQVGTAFLFTAEAGTTPIHRAALDDAAARETAVTNVFTGRPARSLVNRIVRELGPIADSLPDFPLAATLVAPLRAAAEARGSDDFSPLWSGTGAARCRGVTAAELVRSLASGFAR